jgi:threonine/homoserine/homoserine lactone efflux protein
MPQDYRILTVMQTLSSDLWAPLAALVLAALAVMGSPGPATISVTGIGAAFGFRRSAPYVIGCILGTAAVLVIVATGVVSALLALPRVAPVLLAVSAAYLLYLAFRIATAPPLGGPQGAAATPSFAGGFLLGIANPKAYVAIAAVFAGSTLPIEPPSVAALVKTAVLGIMVIVIHIAWLIAGTTLSQLLRHPVRSRIANLLFAVALVATTLMALSG